MGFEIGTNYLLIRTRIFVHSDSSESIFSLNLSFLIFAFANIRVTKLLTFKLFTVLHVGVYFFLLDIYLRRPFLQFCIELFVAFDIWLLAFRTFRCEWAHCISFVFAVGHALVLHFLRLLDRLRYISRWDWNLVVIAWFNWGLTVGVLFRSILWQGKFDFVGCLEDLFFAQAVQADHLTWWLKDRLLTLNQMLLMLFADFIYICAFTFLIEFGYGCFCLDVINLQQWFSDLSFPLHVLLLLFFEFLRGERVISCATIWGLRQFGNRSFSCKIDSGLTGLY